MGVLLLYVSRAKRLLSRICFYKEGNKTVGWNDPLPLYLQKDLDDWLKGLHPISQVTFPRNLFHNNILNEGDTLENVTQLHIFTDGGGGEDSQGYGAVCYTRYPLDSKIITYGTDLIYTKP